jgi:ribosome-associated protein
MSDEIREMGEEREETTEIKYLEMEPDPGQFEKSKELAEKISVILDDKKAGNVKIIETSKQTIIADYFVIATGTSSTHIRSLAGEVEFQLKEKESAGPSRISGHESADWVILDYDCVLVHIFNSEARDYYKLEKLWGEGESVDVGELLKLEKES